MTTWGGYGSISNLNPSLMEKFVTIVDLWLDFSHSPLGEMAVEGYREVKKTFLAKNIRIWATTPNVRSPKMQDT